MITDLWLFDWLLISASLFNSILLLWLALTVLLNAERRTWGVWLIEVGLGIAAVFFISHTVILGQELTARGNPTINFWWRLGWMPIILIPFIWYVIILWYTGFWDSANTALYRRHRSWILISIGILILMSFLIAFYHALPSYTEVTNLYLDATLQVGDVPILFVIWPVFTILCLVLSVDALKRPAPSERMMGDLARQRSRPWLMRTAQALLLVSVLVAAFLVGVGGSAGQGRLTFIDLRLVRWVALFDLLLSLLIACAIMLLGQAVVSYEVFTGKVLPRRGFFRQWRNTILLAMGYASFAGLSVVLGWRSVGSLVFDSVLLVGLSAGLSWRAFVERDQFIKRLRPFVSSQDLMQQMVGMPTKREMRAEVLFQSVCRDVLGAKQAQLVPLGVMASLAGPSLQYPVHDWQLDWRSLPHLLAENPSELVMTIDPRAYHGLRWAIPLWAERGLIGALLLSEKQDGALYSQEEIEIARASGERIVDMLAGEQMAAQLVEMQRQRMFDDRWLDLRTRRVLHDDVLPTLHTAVLALSGASRRPEAVKEAIQTLSHVHHQIADLIHTLPTTSAMANNKKSVGQLLQTLLAEEFEGIFATVACQGEETLPLLNPLATEIVFCAAREALRNIHAHAQAENGAKLRVGIEIEGAEWGYIRIKDDGVGLYHPTHKQAKAGSGGGLALHSTMMAIIGGYLMLETLAEGGTQVRLAFPLADNRA